MLNLQTSHNIGIPSQPFYKLVVNDSFIKLIFPFYEILRDKELVSIKKDSKSKKTITLDNFLVGFNPCLQYDNS